MTNLELVPLEDLLKELGKRTDSFVFMGSQKGYYTNKDEKTIWDISGDTRDAIFMLELLRIKIMSEYIQREQTAEGND